MAIVSPRFLYLGIKVNVSKFDTVALGDKDLEPLNGKNGKRELTLTNNPYIARDNSNNHYEEGTILDKKCNFVVDGEEKFVHLPMVGITYDIDTNDLFLTGPSVGETPNDLSNDEWFISSVPVSNYTVTRVVVGADILHDPEIISFNSNEEIKRKVRKILEKRERHLNDLISEIEKLPIRTRNNLDSSYINMFKSLVGEGGAKYLNFNTYKINTIDNALKYLMAIYYSNNTQRLDFKNLLDIELFRTKLYGNNDLQDLLNLIYMELLSLEEQKKTTIENSDITGDKAKTNKIDITIASRKYMMYRILKNLLDDVNLQLEDNPTDSILLDKKKNLEEQINLVNDGIKEE